MSFPTVYKGSFLSPNLVKCVIFHIKFFVSISIVRNCATIQMKLVLTRDATIQFFQNRSDTTNSEDRPIPIQSDTSAVFFFLCHFEFLYFSVLTRSSLFCVLNTIYCSVSQLVGQKCWVSQKWVARLFWVAGRGSRIVYSQRNDINKKLNSKCFSDARLILKDAH